MSTSFAKVDIVAFEIAHKGLRLGCSGMWRNCCNSPESYPFGLHTKELRNKELIKEL